MGKILSSILGLLLPLNVFAALSGNVNVLTYSSTNVTTGAYVTLVASTPMTTAHLEVCDTSTKLLKLATGAAGSEVDFATVFISGCVSINLSHVMVSGTRIAIEAVDANATAGFNTLSFL